MGSVLEYLGDPSSQWIWGAAQALAIMVGFYFVVRQISLAQQQNSITHMIYFRELWHSPAILRARSDLGILPSEPNGIFRPHEDVLATFANDLGIAVRTGQIDGEHVRRYFGYYITGYWVVLAPQIRVFREAASFPRAYSSFEYLHDLLSKMDRKLGIASMSPEAVERFKQEEMIHAQYFIEANAGKFD